MPETNNSVYPWKRFWCPWEKSISLADDGFVYDPESEYGIILNPDLTTLASTIELPCLILLGEPGLGKSQAVREHHAELESANDSSRRLMLVDLKEFGSDAALTRGLFESKTFQQWKEGEEQLYLFLDSFDEGLLTIEALSGYISRELRALTEWRSPLTADGESPEAADAAAIHDGTNRISSRVGNRKTRAIDRLYLRIVCRPAIWPSSLTTELGGIFSERTVSVWRLAPLRKSDVELAAERKGVSGFVQEVTSRNVVPFATKPITLKTLLNLYQSHQALPRSRYGIYEELCRVACDTSNSRRERQKSGHLTPEERLSVACRIAALMVFGNRGRLRTDLTLGDLADEELSVDAVFGDERQNNHKVAIDSHALAETLDTALFNWPRSHCATWDHRTYCEFLAARYCYVHKIQPIRLKNLIFTEAFGEKRVAPQLYETTAWLCSLYPALQSDVVACDPFVLLISDVLREDFSIRHKVTERYLESFEKERVFRDQIRDELRLLQHPHLAGQLRSYISQKEKKDATRLRAMDIAAECKVPEVEPDLIKIALDSRESLPIRTHALYTLGQYGASASRDMLRELVTKPRGEDKDQEIKGWTLMAIWPDNISASELFAVLTDSDTPGFVGGYASFLHKLSRDIPSILQEDDIETALDWVEKLRTDGYGSNRLSAVADSVLLRAWQSLQNPAILDRFARIVLKRIENHVPIAVSDDVYRPGQPRQFHELLTESKATRRLLITALVRQLAAGPVAFPAIRLMFTPDRIVRPDDTGWLIEQIESSSSEGRPVIESLLDRMPPDDSESLDAFKRAIDEGRLPSGYGTKLYMELSSELAVRLKREYEEYQPRPRELVLLVPSPRARLLELLERIKSGHPEDWSGLIRTLTLEDYSQYYGDEGDDVRKLPGWLAADAQIRGEIVLAAQQFLLGYTPTATEYSQQTFGHWIIAAYLAFSLLHDESMSFLETRDEAFWNRWTGLLLSYRFDHTRGVDRKLLSLVATNYPDALNVGLAEVLSPTLEGCYFLNKLSEAWTPQVEKHLMQMLQQGALKCHCCDVILSLLLEKGSTEAEDFVIAMVELATDSDSQVRGAIALLKHAPRKSQDVVWPLIKASDTVGQRIIESVSDMGGNAKFVESWSESAIGELFVWMVKKYPYSETDYRRGGAFAVGTAHTVMYLRDALLTHLRSRGTAEAVDALRRAGKELNIDWMKWHIVEAKNVAFRREWKPAEPSSILSLAADSESMTPAETRSRTATLLAVILNVLAGLMIPAQLSSLDRTCLLFGLALVVLILTEKANSKQSFFFPLYLILLLTDIAAYLLLRFMLP